MLSFPPLYPYSSFKFNKIDNNREILFFNSARSGLFLIVDTLKEMYEELIFLIPTYNCYSIVATLESAKVEYDFVDIDESLDFDLSDLNERLDVYSNKKIILIATSLFGIKLREYKSLYSDLIVIEDLAQSTFDNNSKADFSFVSFGKGKIISSWSGGGVITNNQLFREKYNKLNIESQFLKPYILSNIQKIISKYFWFFIENSSLNPEKSTHIEVMDDEILKLSKNKIYWILNSLNELNLTHRREISNYYLNNISKKYLFDLKLDTPYLRMPIKKVINQSGISFLKDYEFTYKKAIEKRKNSFKIPEVLLYESSFLPTHNLIDLKYAKKLVELINE